MKEILFMIVGGLLVYVFVRKMPEGDDFREKRDAIKRITDYMPVTDLIDRANSRFKDKNKPK